MIATGFIRQIKSFSATFWLINALQMLEKMAFVIVLLQMPIYLSQKDIEGGMYLDQAIKGLIFFFWAIVQRLTPIFTGGFADRYGYKRTLFVSFIIITASYIILGTQREYYAFLFGIMLLGFGSGVFLPALQASLASSLPKGKESTGWAIYFMLLNLGVFFAPPISKYFRELSWESVFIGSAIVFSLNFILLFFFKDITTIKKDEIVKNQDVFASIFRNFIKPEILYFVLIMSGFVIIYMQFYETFPNFFVDWVDTSELVQVLNLPEFMLFETSVGTMLSYEWIRNINSGIIIIGIVPVSWIMSKLFRVNALAIGCFLATLGLFLCGVSSMGWIVILGIIIYTFGEMITNPKFTEHISSIAPLKEKAMYMSYLNISFAIGLGGGAILGGYMYKIFGEKAYLAKLYLAEKYNVFDGIELTNSFKKLQVVSGMDAGSATKLLWDYYNPYVLWYPFLLIGLLSVIGLIVYSIKYRN